MEGVGRQNDGRSLRVATSSLTVISGVAGSDQDTDLQLISDNLVAPPTTRKMTKPPINSVKTAAISFLNPVVSRQRRETSPRRGLGLRVVSLY